MQQQQSKQIKSTFKHQECCIRSEGGDACFACRFGSLMTYFMHTHEFNEWLGLGIHIWITIKELVVSYPIRPRFVGRLARIVNVGLVMYFRHLQESTSSLRCGRRSMCKTCSTFRLHTVHCEYCTVWQNGPSMVLKNVLLRYYCGPSWDWSFADTTNAFGKRQTWSHGSSAGTNEHQSLKVLDAVDSRQRCIFDVSSSL